MAGDGWRRKSWFDLEDNHELAIRHRLGRDLTCDIESGDVVGRLSAAAPKRISGG
jgi:hypothetical protein